MKINKKLYLIGTLMLSSFVCLCSVAHTMDQQINNIEVNAEDVPVLQDESFYSLDFRYPINNSFICYDHYDVEYHYLYELTGDFDINVDVLYKVDTNDFRVHYNTLNYNLTMRVYQLEYEDDRLMYTNSYSGFYDYDYIVSGYLDDIMVTNLKSTLVIGYDTYYGYLHLGFIESADSDLIYDIKYIDNDLFSFTSDYFGFNANFIRWIDDVTGDSIRLSTHILLSSADIYTNAQNFVKNVVNSQNASNSYLNGYETGYKEGYDKGSTSGYAKGYNVGYNEGMDTDSTIFHVFNGILNVALVPVNFFLGIFNFEILGINISSLITSLLTLMCVIMVLKLIFGGGGKNE